MKIMLNTPIVDSMQDVKTVVLEQTAEKIHSQSTYPNGLIIDFVTTADGINVTSNWEIEHNEDGSINFVEPKN